jgi:hypothetical protein
VASVAPAPAARVLRVGVFADHARQPRWIVDALARVAACGFAELAFVATENRGQTPISEPLLWKAYCGVDRWMFGAAPDASEASDVTHLVPAALRVAFDPGAARIADERLDVAFAVGDVDDRALEGIARHGVWRYCFGEEHDVRVPLAGVREVIDGKPVMASGIRIHRGAGAADRIACPSWSRTVDFSLARSRDGVLPKTSRLLERTLRELHASGPAWLEHGSIPAREPGSQPLPTGPQLVRGVTRVGARVVRRAAEKVLTVGQWQLAVRFAREASADPLPWSGSLAGFTRLVPPRDRFWADPFPISVGDRHYIFFEDLPFATGKAHISVVEVDRTGRASAPVPVLERDYHLSYPFLVEDGGSLYMIPETAHNRTVEIYRCVEFPHRWKLERTLLNDVWCADATVHRALDRWWMFAAFGTDGAEVNDELHLFSADRLLGEWKPHRRNPVRSDVRGARPAGRLFARGGSLWRPGQVCAPLYGAGIALHRVTRLTQDEYAEEEVRRIAPVAGEGVLGLHTINRAGDLQVTDAFVRRPRF